MGGYSGISSVAMVIFSAKVVNGFKVHNCLKSFALEFSESKSLAYSVRTQRPE